MPNNIKSGLGLLGVLVLIPLAAHIIKQTKMIGEKAGFKENKKNGGKNA